MARAIGKISQSMGTVSAISDDDLGRDLRVGSEIFYGDLVSVKGLGSSANIVFSNGFSMTLSAGESALIDETVYQLESFEDTEVKVDMDEIYQEVTSGNGFVESQVDESKIAERIDFASQLNNSEEDINPRSDTQRTEQVTSNEQQGFYSTPFAEITAARAKVEIVPDEPNDDDQDSQEDDNGADLTDQLEDSNLDMPIIRNEVSLDLESLASVDDIETDNNLNGLNMGDVMQVSNKDANIDKVSSEKEPVSDSQDIKTNTENEDDTDAVYTDSSVGDEFDIPIDQIAALGLDN
mgnify:CR=1 FL=1